MKHNKRGSFMKPISVELPILFKLHALYSGAIDKAKAFVEFIPG